MPKFPSRTRPFLWLFFALLSGVDASLAALTPTSPAPAGFNEDQALTAFQNGDFEKVIVILKETGSSNTGQASQKSRSHGLILLGQAYQALGQYSRSLEPLQQACDVAESQEDIPQEARALSYLALAYHYTGSADKSDEALAKATALADEVKLPEALALVKMHAASILMGQEHPREALSACSQAIEWASLSTDPQLLAKLHAERASILLRLGAPEKEVQADLTTAANIYRTLSSSHDTAYGCILTARTFRQLSRTSAGSTQEHRAQALRLLEQAFRSGEAMGDLRTMSYAAGYLGGWYEDAGHYDTALQWTRRAVFASQQRNLENLYLWQWQSGRLFKAMGKPREALNSYRNAVNQLQSIRQEMLQFCQTPSQRPYGESMTPIFFEYADLLLHMSSSATAPQERNRFLTEARETIEKLKVVELQDYFQNPCAIESRLRQTKLEEVSRDAAVIYTITFADRLELLVSRGSAIHRTTVPVGSQVLNTEIRSLAAKLQQTRLAPSEYLPSAQKLYQWIIGPLEDELKASGVTALIFVPDGALRTIPMAALHDGEQFLISRFAVVTTPGLNLTDPKPIKREALDVFTAGLTVGVQGFSPLHAVKLEMQAMRSLYNADCIQDDQFMTAKVREKLKKKPYSVVHIATHGQFAPKASETFLLTYDGKINMDQLHDLMRECELRKQPVELLTLSACQTAAGDEQSALGLAGVAIRAGARSTLATLWSVSDQATALLVEEFYKQLNNPAVSKARALQQAQLKLLGMRNYRHPFFWAPFLLIGNWL